MRTYEEENAILLENMIENKFFRADLGSFNSIELNITATCNQACEYCYLTKYGKELYPINIRDEKLIIKNTKMFLEYLAKKKVTIGTLSLFAGEIWGTKFSNDFFETLYDNIGKGFNYHSIMIPSNMSFLTNEQYKQNIENWIEKFKKRGIIINFSSSIDGLYVEDQTRPFKDKSLNGSRNQEFYDKIFQWNKHYDNAYHPMVSAGAIENWKENYVWWHHMMQKYNLNPFKMLMTFEVRNDEWTKEKIQHYLDFLDFTIEYDLNTYCFGNLNTFAKYIFGSHNDRCYRGYVINPPSKHLQCTIDKDLIVRMGDLAIGACHRTHYEQFIYGWYKVDGEEIVGLTANNIQLANMFWYGADTCFVGCCHCPISKFCMKQCFGAQYEANGEIMTPCESVCNLYKAKLTYLVYKLAKLGYNETNLKADYLHTYKELLEGVKGIQKGGFNLWDYLSPELQMTIS